MKLFQVISTPFYFVTFAVAAIVLLALYVFIHLIGIVQNFDVWLADLPWFNAVFLLLFSVLFGLAFSFQVYIWKSPKTCSVKKRIHGGALHSIGTVGALLIAQCPGCATFTALFLPVSAIGFLTQFSLLLNFITIGLLVFTLHYLGAFSAEEPVVITNG